MINPGFDDYVKSPVAKLYAAAAGSEIRRHLLWGDGVRRLGEQSGKRVKVRARGRTCDGWIDEGDLGGRSLLEVYFIDVGQGDGVLIKTPDFRHVMIDGGHPRKSQNTGKSAADFVDWKFYEDYGLDQVRLDAMIASHNDYDHYGGLGDLLDAGQEDELDVGGVTVERFHHAGVSWWRGPDNKGRTLGPVARGEDGREYYVQLLEDRASAEAGLSGRGPALQGEWRDFITRVTAARTEDGSPTPFQRLSQRTEHLPGFETGSGVEIRVLGPVEADVAGGPGLPKLGKEDKTTNGNSVLLRLDYGRSRILLTGDLNRASQTTLLEAYAGRRLEFQCDVAKACHHGSDDVSYAFLQAMEPAATVISSGDGEGHDHPRPRIVAASGVTGHLRIENDEIVTPLVYSTELARSVSTGELKSIRLHANDGGARLEGAVLGRARVDYEVTKPGALRPEKEEKGLGRCRIVAGLVYGLVNVRTDGETILTATLNEGKGSWAWKQFPSRF